MNKAELVDVIARRTGASKAMTDSMIDALVDSVTATLKKGESVTLVGFGTFSQGKRSARTGRNPQTGVAIKIPAARTAKFAAGTKLKAAVNGKK
ncbi:MAG TPA: HU family DNA-binding protein [Burkholderiales bacterium]|jgi:DNA-binding protein HU-beta|nr:HU family DNA-binding protein [Burkholderiales bacterium]